MNDTHKIIKEKIYHYMGFIDLMVDRISTESDGEMEAFAKIVKADFDKESPYQACAEHRYRGLVKVLLDDDLQRACIELSAYYELANLVGVDLELTEFLKNRLDFLLKRTAHLFVLTNKGIQAKDNTLLENVEREVFDVSEEKYQNYVNHIRNTDEYKVGLQALQDESVKENQVETNGEQPTETKKPKKVKKRILSKE